MQFLLTINKICLWEQLAGLVQSWAAIVMGILSGSIPWVTMMILHKKSTLLQKVTLYFLTSPFFFFFTKIFLFYIHYFLLFHFHYLFFSYLLSLFLLHHSPYLLFLFFSPSLSSSTRFLLHTLIFIIWE